MPQNPADYSLELKRTNDAIDGAAAHHMLDGLGVPVFDNTVSGHQSRLPLAYRIRLLLEQRWAEEKTMEMEQILDWFLVTDLDGDQTVTWHDTMQAAIKVGEQFVADAAERGPRAYVYRISQTAPSWMAVPRKDA
jgi:hypothetical protein